MAFLVFDHAGDGGGVLVVWVLGAGGWGLGAGFWVLGAGFWVLGAGFWVLGFRFWALEAGGWGLGPRFARWASRGAFGSAFGSGYHIDVYAVELLFGEGFDDYFSFTA